MKRSLVGLALAGAIALSLPGSGFHVETPDPQRWCYTLDGPDELWSCYLKADRIEGQGPVWVGPESEIRTAHSELAGVPEGIEPCEFEDSLNCYWDAKQNGNEEGRSFWSDKHGTIHYDEIDQ